VKKKMKLPRSPPTIVMYSVPASCGLYICIPANITIPRVKDRRLDTPADTAEITKVSLQFIPVE